MAFWSRLKQVKPKIHLLHKEFTRCYISNQVLSAGNQLIFSRTLIPISSNPNLAVAQSNPFVGFCKIRFYAAPVQFQSNNQKKEEKDSSGPKLNEQITAQFIRLVTDEGHSVISRYDALARAKSLNMDLVEVDANVKPVVCKIYNYNKERYLRKVKEKENKKSKKNKGLKSGAFKEVRFAAKISKQDLQVKADTVKRLMESGYRVKCTAVEPTDALDLETLLSRFSSLIKDVAIEEGGTKVEKKQAFVVVRHVKFGLPKKAGKASKSADPMLISPTEIQSSENESLNKNPDTDKTISYEADEDVQNKPEWTVSDEDNDLNMVFDIEDETDGSTKPRHALKSEQASVNPPEVPKHGMTNRYARDPRSVNPVPQFPNHAKQPQFGMNATMPHQRFEPVQPQVPSHSSARNFPTNGYVPNERNQPQFNANPSPQMIPRQRFEPVQPQAPSHSSARNFPTNGYVPNEQNQPLFNANASPQMMPHQPFEPVPPQALSNSSARNFPTNGYAPHVPNERNQPQFNLNTPPQTRPMTPRVEVPKQECSNSNGFGIFTPQKVDTRPQGQSAPPESNNRYKKVAPADSARGLSNPGLRMNRGPGGNNGEPGKWGVFGSGNANGLPNKNEGQA